MGGGNSRIRDQRRSVQFPRPNARRRSSMQNICNPSVGAIQLWLERGG